MAQNLQKKLMMELLKPVYRGLISPLGLSDSDYKLVTGVKQSFQSIVDGVKDLFQQKRKK